MKHNTSSFATGFSLVELVVTVAIAGVLGAVAIPSFISTINNSRVIGAANQMVTALNLARSEAIKRGVQVTVLSVSGVDSQWEDGWNVFVDLDGDGTLDEADPATPCQAGDDCLLRTFDPLPNGFTMRTGSNYSCWVAYQSNGLSRGSGSGCTGGLGNDTFRLCDSSADTSRSRSIAVTASGRARVETGTDSCP